MLLFPCRGRATCSLFTIASSVASGLSHATCDMSSLLLNIGLATLVPYIVALIFLRGTLLHNALFFGWCWYCYGAGTLIVAGWVGRWEFSRREIWCLGGRGLWIVLFLWRLLHRHHWEFILKVCLHLCHAGFCMCRKFCIFCDGFSQWIAVYMIFYCVHYYSIPLLSHGCSSGTRQLSFIILNNVCWKSNPFLPVLCRSFVTFFYALGIQSPCFC